MMRQIETHQYINTRKRQNLAENLSKKLKFLFKKLNYENIYRLYLLLGNSAPQRNVLIHTLLPQKSRFFLQNLHKILSFSKNWRNL